MPNLNNVKSPKEVLIAGGATLTQGLLYVNNDNGVPFAAPRTDTAASIATTLGIVTGITTIDLGARRVAEPDTGTDLFGT
jgi:hypothetical protein